MSDKRLSGDGDRIVLSDAATAKTALRRRSKQLPVVMLFVVLAAIAAGWKILSAM